MPLQQHLEAGDHSGVEHDDRLRGDPQLVAFHGVPQGGVEIEALRDLGFEQRIEDVDVVTVGELGPVHRHVGFTHQLVAGDGGLVGERDPDAGVDERFLAVDRVRGAQRGTNAFGQCFGMRPVWQFRHSTTNSSPPRRATVSLSRTVPDNRRAASISS